MFLADFLYIIKRVLSSPLVIGIVIAALLYLQLVFYILGYSKKKTKRIKKTSKSEKTKPKAKVSEAEKEKEVQENE